MRCRRQCAEQAHNFLICLLLGNFVSAKTRPPRLRGPASREANPEMDFQAFPYVMIIGPIAIGIVTFIVTLLCFLFGPKPKMDKETKYNIIICTLAYLAMILAPQTFSAPLYYKETTVIFGRGLPSYAHVPLHIDWALGSVIGPIACVFVLRHMHYSYMRALNRNTRAWLVEGQPRLCVFGLQLCAALCFCAPVIFNYFGLDGKVITKVDNHMVMQIDRKKLIEFSFYNEILAIAGFAATISVMTQMVALFLHGSYAFYSWSDSLQGRTMTSALLFALGVAMQIVMLFIFYFIPVLVFQYRMFYRIYEPILNNLLSQVLVIQGAVSILVFVGAQPFFREQLALFFTSIPKWIWSCFLCIFKSLRVCFFRLFSLFRRCIVRLLGRFTPRENTYEETGIEMREGNARAANVITVIGASPVVVNPC
ncbi:unnamed protein product [Caenorhabditis auriculariae]|uniref:Uncharacterized protein n=1 Tax=Caenorhabditis auriculariae TaxID=2777116 RepID=A0A8S1HGD9_9PELO|nr:unnamed protein product [Caenorhabditis auriculariae]